jgi:secondary thiamine-phosphate synthase enzyme
MKIINKEIQFKTAGDKDVKDLTSDVAQLINQSSVESGIVTVFVPGSTAGITTIEFEPGAISDLTDRISKLIPRDIYYKHNERWGDGNGFSHVSAAVLGPSLTVPFANKKLMLGTWQQIVFLEFDNHPRNRIVAVQIMGE